MFYFGHILASEDTVAFWLLVTQPCVIVGLDHPPSIVLHSGGGPGYCTESNSNDLRTLCSPPVAITDT